MSHVLVMGVCGCGKSLVGSAITERLGATFVEGDEFHPPENVAHMKAGHPLDDQMRFGWLDAIGDAVAAMQGRAVIACSALKASYRERLSAKIGDMLIVHLTGKPGLLEERVTQRKAHFMPASLVASQFAVLEPPSGPMTIEIDVALTPDEVVERAVAFIRSADARSVA
ncbi:gluconokinase [Litorisediminicola beolgyonensis]|uniref:Gluconokinase n=1 Tax=Litorisediminicola beolgyonensis TaxID=1173614 RepID=A0ABW3ZIC1_9RHOB